MLDIRTNSVVIKLNGVEHSIPVNNLSNELSVELIDVEKRKLIVNQKIGEKQTQINLIRDLIQSEGKLSGEEISARLSEIDEHAEELAKLNSENQAIISDYYRLYLSDYEGYKHIIRQIPLEYVWEFIQELFYASQGIKKNNTPDKIEQEPSSPKSETKSDSAKPAFRKKR